MDMNASLARAMAAVPQCKACELVGRDLGRGGSVVAAASCGRGSTVKGAFRRRGLNRGETGQRASYRLSHCDVTGRNAVLFFSLRVLPTHRWGCSSTWTRARASTGCRWVETLRERAGVAPTEGRFHSARACVAMWWSGIDVQVGLALTFTVTFQL